MPKKRLTESTATNLAGFGQHVKQIRDEQTGRVICFTSTKQDDTWIHFPTPISKKEFKHLIDFLEFRK